MAPDLPRLKQPIGRSRMTSASVRCHVSQGIRIGRKNRNVPVDASAWTRFAPHHQKGTRNMAQQTTVTLTDDIDGGKAAETVSFGLDGRIYEIDLSKKNATALRKALGEFTASARHVRAGQARGQGGARLPPGSTPRRFGNGHRSRALRYRLAVGFPPRSSSSTRRRLADSSDHCPGQIGRHTSDLSRVSSNPATRISDGRNGDDRAEFGDQLGDPGGSKPWSTRFIPRSFADSDGDGIGDLRGIIGRLDYLAELGVDVIWLSPVYPSPQDDNGYDISDYQDIEPTFGTLDDFDELLAGVHDRGMKLVMDLVVNHTSDEHPWFVESRSSRDQPEAGLVLVAARPGRIAAGYPWCRADELGLLLQRLGLEIRREDRRVLPAPFSVKQPDLNWENPDVRQAVYQMMRWWLDRGVDGFRMDVINMISKDTALPDGADPARRTVRRRLAAFPVRPANP